MNFYPFHTTKESPYGKLLKGYIQSSLPLFRPHDPDRDSPVNTPVFPFIRQHQIMDLFDDIL
jgi:hypothetical protein